MKLPHAKRQKTMHQSVPGLVPGLVPGSVTSSVPGSVTSSVPGSVPVDVHDRRLSRSPPTWVIYGHMMVGSLNNARNKDELDADRITLTINMCHTCTGDSREVHVPFRDQVDENFNKMLCTILPQIASALLNNCRVLVHCYAGISRSVSMCTAYLMIVYSKTFDAAICEITLLRPQADMNFGFCCGLAELGDRSAANLAELRSILTNTGLSTVERSVKFAHAFAKGGTPE